MAGLSGIPRSSLCLFCMKRIAGGSPFQLSSPSLTQIRGKKKTAKKITTINVRLLADIKGYGRKGSITPVAPGRMRNTWYPRQQAEYISTLQAKPRDIVAERDFSFGVQNQAKQEVETAPKSMEQPKVVVARTKLLQPERATEILSSALPSHLIFYRTPIVNPEPDIPAYEPPRSRPRKAASSAAAELDAASEPSPEPPQPQTVTIFGSVSTADMAEAIKAVLAETEDGKRIVIGAEDITLMSETGETSTIEGDRVKALGDFPVQVRVKGGEPVQRIVSVRAQEASQ